MKLASIMIIAVYFSAVCSQETTDKMFDDAEESSEEDSDEDFHDYTDYDETSNDDDDEEIIFPVDAKECIPMGGGGGGGGGGIGPPPDEYEDQRRRQRTSQRVKSNNNRRAPQSASNKKPASMVMNPLPSCKRFFQKMAQELQKIKKSGKGSMEGCKQKKDPDTCMWNLEIMARSEMKGNVDAMCLEEVKKFYGSW